MYVAGWMGDMSAGTVFGPHLLDSGSSGMVMLMMMVMVMGAVGGEEEEG